MQINIQKAPTKIPIKTMPSQFEIMMLEEDLRMRFDAQISRLVDLYLLAVKFDIEHLQNNAIDSIQDGFHEYGTVFWSWLDGSDIQEHQEGFQAP